VSLSTVLEFSVLKHLSRAFFEEAVRYVSHDILFNLSCGCQGEFVRKSQISGLLVVSQEGLCELNESLNQLILIFLGRTLGQIMAVDPNSDFLTKIFVFNTDTLDITDFWMR